MRKLRWPVRVYVIAVIAAGLVGLLVAPRDVARLDDLQAFAVLTLLATMGRLRPVHVNAKVKMSVADMATFAAALLLGPFLSMLVAAVSAIVGLQFSSPMALYNRFFNASASAISTGSAAVAYAALAGDDRSLIGTPLAVAFAAVIKYVVHTALVDGVVSLQLRRSPFASWWHAHRPDIAQQGALLALGVLAAVSAKGHPWVLVLFVVPMGLVLVTLQQTTRLRQQTRDAIIALADLIDARDKYTYGHSLRVADASERIARRLKLQTSQVEVIREAARLHDIGKIGTHDHVLQKPGPLDEHEMEHMRLHADAGRKFLEQLPDFWEGAALVGAHHERPDGRGYPRALQGSEVPFEVSVIAVADAFDAMTTDRPYRAAMSWDQVHRELLTGRGTQWHTRAVDALIAIVEEDRLGTVVERKVIASRAV